METRPVVGEERFLLSDISWGFYLADLEPYLQITDDTDETTRIRRFRDWLRERTG